ncbi:MAG: hypothetical protein AMXMBFR61_06910 [Fimbriimonadales bacterium]
MDRSRLLDLNEVVQHPGRSVEFDVLLDGVDEPDVALASPIGGTLRAQCDGRVLLLQGNFHTTAVLECVRCTIDVEVPIEFAVEETFPITGTPGSLSHSGAAYVDDAEEPFPLFVENRLKIEELIRQILLVELPAHPLCSAECLGLCEHCGANLNEGPCECGSDAGNPVFRALAEEWSKTEPA